MDPKVFRDAFDRLGKLEEGREDEMEEAVDELRDIQEGLFELIDRLDGAIRTYLPHSHSNLEAYLLSRLKIAAGSEQYVSNDPSIEKVIEMIQDEMGAEDEDEF